MVHFGQCPLQRNQRKRFHEKQPITKKKVVPPNNPPPKNPPPKTPPTNTPDEKKKGQHQKKHKTPPTPKKNKKPALLSTKKTQIAEVEQTKKVSKARASHLKTTLGKGVL